MLVTVLLLLTQVLPLLTTVMYNVTPYLRHHSLGNQGAYRAGSQVSENIVIFCLCIDTINTIQYNILYCLSWLYCALFYCTIVLYCPTQVLASLSEYQYTRRAWRKEGMELLLDPAFFQMDYESLSFWKTTIDNLMTHDKTTFKVSL